jgi:hypothetical protein
MKMNVLEMEWTDEGCVAYAEGFDGVILTCPRCQEPLPRDIKHRCGDKLAGQAKRTRKPKEPPCPKE